MRRKKFTIEIKNLKISVQLEINSNIVNNWNINRQRNQKCACTHTHTHTHTDEFNCNNKTTLLLNKINISKGNNNK
jgi:hypothetical protein